MDTTPTSIGAWVSADAGTKINYDLCADTIEFSFEGIPHFNLTFEEPALAQCIATFIEALTDYRAAHAQQQ